MSLESQLSYHLVSSLFTKRKTPLQALTSQFREGILALYQSIHFDKKVIFSYKAEDYAPIYPPII